MRSNQSNFIFFALAIAFVLSACTGRVIDDNGENVIGNTLQSVTPLRENSGSQKQTVALYDDVVKKIHQFDLNQMKVERTLPVTNTSAKHYVLHSGSTNYIVDFSEKHLSIYDRYSYGQHQPVTFLGKPKSAAFRPEIGLLVFYDDLQSVAIIKLSAEGQVLDKHVFGSVVDGLNTIVSGDLLENGRLILALSNNTIISVDVNASLAAKNWVTDPAQATNLTKITWIAPVPGNTNRIFIRTETQLVLYDLVSATIVQQQTLSVNEQLIKLSKSSNPHIVTSVSSTAMKIYYTDGNTILTRQFNLANKTAGYGEVSPILESDLANGMWTYVYISNFRGYSIYNDVNQVKEQRTLVRVRLQDALAIQSKKLPDRSQVKLSGDYFFAMYPSPLGLAEKYSIMNNDKFVMRNFNLNNY